MEKNKVKSLIAAGSAWDGSHWGVPLMCCNTSVMDSQILRNSQILHKETLICNSCVEVSLRSVDPRAFIIQRLNLIADYFLITTKLHLTQYHSDIKWDFTYNVQGFLFLFFSFFPCPSMYVERTAALGNFKFKLKSVLYNSRDFSKLWHRWISWQTAVLFDLFALTLL